MSENTQTKPTKTFWIISIAALLWNLMGLMSFIMEVTLSEEALAALPEDQRALYETNPSWMPILYGLAVITGTLACVFLLMKKSLAVPLFVLSFIAVIIQMTYWLVFTESLNVYGPGGAVMPLLVIFVGGFLVWYTKKVKTVGWIN